MIMLIMCLIVRYELTKNEILELKQKFHGEKASHEEVE